MKHFLIVVDMQNDFINGSLGSKEAENIVDAAADMIKNFCGEIFITLDTHFEDYLSTSEGKKLPVMHCINGTHGWQLNAKIAAALDGKSITKVEKLTFGSTKLPLLIEKAAGDEDFDITLIGLRTDICVVSNALMLKAHFPEKDITVDADLCAGVTPDSHIAALATMKMCQINIKE